MSTKKGRKPLTTAYAIRSFVGHLEGTQKASLTIGSYRSDLETFNEFLKAGLSSKSVRLDQIQSRDLKVYSEFLSRMGLKTNTRRRKLLTVRRFLRYLTQRGKLKQDPGLELPAPYKVERIPATIDLKALLSAIQKLPTETIIQKRNRLLLWTLAESGCLVSEAAGLKSTQWVSTPEGPFLEIIGKSARKLPVSPALYQEVQTLQMVSNSSPRPSSFLFIGFNRFGPMGNAISPRGIELLVRHLAPVLGFPTLTPRMIRHSSVVQWHQEGLTQEQIRIRLGLKTDYAFRIYQPLFRSKKKTTSTVETLQ